MRDCQRTHVDQHDADGTILFVSEKGAPHREPLVIAGCCFWVLAGLLLGALVTNDLGGSAPEWSVCVALAVVGFGIFGVGARRWQLKHGRDRRRTED